jgi:hypothetical protein
MQQPTAEQGAQHTGSGGKKGGKFQIFFHYLH